MSEKERPFIDQISDLVDAELSPYQSRRGEKTQMAAESCFKACVAWRAAIQQQMRGFNTDPTYTRTKLDAKTSDAKVNAFVKALALARELRTIMREALAGVEPGEDERGTTLTTSERILLCEMSGSSCGGTWRR